MGKVTYSPGIEFVQGSLAKPKKQDGHSHGDYLIGTHHTAATTNPACTRIYVRKGDTYGKNISQTPDSQWARGRFQNVASAVATRAKDLTKVTTDNAAFLAQKDQPGGKKTMKSYLWKICGDAYDEQHPRD